MDSATIRENFLKFFEEKVHSKRIDSSSLIPRDDPSVLFTTAGMQQFKPYYIGAKNPQEDFGTLNVVSVQKCVRTSDIDEVGDKSHLTFFEMLGNFSFGGYWKEDSIKYAHEFITSPDWMNLKIDYVSVFKGEGDIPPDTDSENIWKSIDAGIRIEKFGKADNFWGPTGDEGPCGPTTEIYVDGIEIWNIVFNEYYQNKDRSLKFLEISGVDTGMGLERLAKVVQKVPTVFETDLFEKIISKITDEIDEKNKRIIADHIRTSVFIIASGITPSNTEMGYVLRRLIRLVTKSEGSQIHIAEAVIENYKDQYPELQEMRKKILSEIEKEEEGFRRTLNAGLKQFEKGEDPFVLYTTYGFPIDFTRKLAKEKGIKIDEEDFQEKFKQHQEISRAGAEQKFKGGLAGTGEMEIKYHTATHLLHQALRDVLGSEIRQKGSNITSERLRFDFSFPRKMTDEEKKKIEDIVNEKISDGLPMQKMVMKKEEAEKTGVLHFFGEKYGDEVDVYFIGDTLDTAYSKEFCGGPHVSNTKELGHFRIIKEEAISAGVRRIKAVLE